MAEGSRVSLRYIKETEYGVTPDGQMTAVNFTEESFALSKTKEKSKKILPTREYSGVVSKTEMTEGGFGNPLQAVNTDELLEGVLMSSWADVIGGTGGGKITAGATASNLDIVFAEEAVPGDGGTITFGSAVTVVIVKDQVIFVNGTPNTGENDGAYLVKDITGKVVTVNAPLVDATYQADCIVSGDMIRNGNTIQSYTFERAHLDITKFFQYIGEVLANMEVTWEPENELMVAFEYSGKGETRSSATASNPTPDANVDTPDFMVGEDVDGVFFDYEVQAACLIQALSFKVDNQTEGRKSIAVFGPCAQRIKPIDITGSMTMFFNDLLTYNKFPDDVPFQLCIIQADSLGNKYAFTLANIEFTTGTANAKDMESEVPEEHDFQGSTDGAFTVQFCKDLV